MGANAQTTRDDWIDEALRAIEEGGVEAVRVESLARRLKVSKGGFYWNFENRDQLLDAALKRWEERATNAVIRHVKAIEDPVARLEQLFDISSWNIETLRIEAAIASASIQGDKRIQRVYRRVNRRRFEYVITIYEDMGLSASEARTWATSGYVAFLGTSQLVALDPAMLGSERELERHRRHIRAQLVPPRI